LVELVFDRTVVASLRISSLHLPGEWRSSFTSGFDRWRKKERNAGVLSKLTQLFCDLAFARISTHGILACAIHENQRHQSSRVARIF